MLDKTLTYRKDTLTFVPFNILLEFYEDYKRLLLTLVIN